MRVKKEEKSNIERELNQSKKKKKEKKILRKFLSLLINNNFEIINCNYSIFNLEFLENYNNLFLAREHFPYCAILDS